MVPGLEDVPHVEDVLVVLPMGYLVFPHQFPAPEGSEAKLVHLVPDVLGLLAGFVNTSAGVAQVESQLEMG